jgi:hypothetical protein
MTSQYKVIQIRQPVKFSIRLLLVFVKLLSDINYN